MKASIICPNDSGVLRKDVPNLSIFAHSPPGKGENYSPEKYIALGKHKEEWLCLDILGNVRWTPENSKVYVVGKLILEN